MTKLLFMAGSTRKGSFNQRLSHTAEKIARESGVETEIIDLADYEMPLFNEDLESADGLPANAIALKKKFQECDGFFLACPEYNSSIPPLLKNTIDWISRPHEEGEGGLSAFKGKVAALGSASPGSIGGMRGLVVVRMLLGNIGVHVCPTQVAVADAGNAFNEIGLINDGKMSLLKATVSQLVTTTKSMNA